MAQCAFVMNDGRSPFWLTQRHVQYVGFPFWWYQVMTGPLVPALHRAVYAPQFYGVLASAPDPYTLGGLGVLDALKSPAFPDDQAPEQVHPNPVLEHGSEAVPEAFPEAFPQSASAGPTLPALVRPVLQDLPWEVSRVSPALAPTPLVIVDDADDVNDAPGSVQKDWSRPAALPPLAIDNNDNDDNDDEPSTAASEAAPNRSASAPPSAPATQLVSDDDHRTVKLCQQCRQCAPHRPGMWYCLRCFQAMPFCRNVAECGLRAEQNGFGYCNMCYRAKRKPCVVCQAQFCCDDSGLCATCTTRAPPRQSRQCQGWWLEQDHDGPTYRVACLAQCHRRNHFCGSCWQSRKAGKGGKGASGAAVQ